MVDVYSYFGTSEQSTFMAFGRVDDEGVYLSTGTPLPADIQKIVETMLNDSFKTAYRCKLSPP